MMRDGDDVPMPDTSELANAMSEAFIEVRYDVGDNNDNVPFKLHITEAEHADALDWDSAAENSEAYWVAYILGAFQWEFDEEHDPYWNVSTVGATSSSIGGSIILLETIVDDARDFGYDAVAKEQDTVVHEVGHAVGNAGYHPVTQWGSNPSRYDEYYLREIRSAQKPLSP